MIFNDDEVRRSCRHAYDAAHPLRITEAVLDPLLAGATLSYDRVTPLPLEGYASTVSRYIVARMP